MTIILKLLCALLAAAILSGCAASMAARQPGKRDLGILIPGAPRGLLIAEFGAPVHSETRDGRRTDIFSFVQGYGKGAKAGRTAGHAVATVFTFGLWEVVGMPTEATFSGESMVAEVTYLPDSDRAESVKWLKKR